MKRWLLRLAAGASLLALTGCGALGLIGDIGGGGNDGDVAAIIAALSGTWTVTAYSGTETGAVTVDPNAQMRWRLRTDLTFQVTSAAPVSVGGENTRTYDEAGRWRVISGATGTLGMVFSRLDGADVAPGQQVEATCHYAYPDTHQLILTTDGIGPGSVRYVLSR